MGVIMFKFNPYRPISVFAIILCMSGFSHAQINEKGTQDLKTTALGLFEKGEYAQAYEAYSQLLSRYPKDGLFNYYAGLSLLKQKKDAPGAIRLLEFASSKAQVPTEVYYYLGQAYRDNYKFSESRDAYIKYARLADKNALKENLPEHEAQMSANAVLAIEEYNPFDILATSLFTFRDSNYVRQVKGKGGQLMIKPRELFGKEEKEGDLTNYMFMPKNVSKGEYIFISGTPRSKKRGSDLFRIKKLNGNNWSDPVAIERINSNYDEIMPYFDPIGKDLYYASKGHNSMGGFDIFKSHYDPDRDSWSEPVGLGFPINSPDNEFLLIPGSDLGTVQLLTDRQGIDSMYTVYKLHIQEPKKSLATATQEEIMQIGKLGGIEAIPSIVDIRQEKGKNREEISQPAAVVVTSMVDANASANNSQLKSAMRYQVISDSLSILAGKARINVKEMSDPNERWDWQRKIIEWEKYSKDFQEKANKSFADLQLDREYQTANPVPPGIKKDTVINGITLFSYTANDGIKISGYSQESFPAQENKVNKESVPPFKKSLSEKPDDLDPTGTPKNISEEPTLIQKNDEGVAPLNTKRAELDFTILGKSPYNSDNPFLAEESLPQGPFYRIQIGVYSQARDWDTFRGITPITEEKIEDRGLFKYYAGKFQTYQEARNAVEKIKLYGFTDAFIVGWYDGQKMAVERVYTLEKRDRK